APDAESTLLSARGTTQRLAGLWAFPRVTFGGAVEGLSHDRRTLVLAQPPQNGQLDSPTRFAVVDPRSLKLRQLVTIPGRYAFDALSPDARKLYLIEFVSVT